MNKRWWFWPVFFAIAAFLWRLPFIHRYDLNYQTESGVRYLMSKHILRGELPVYFWDSDYWGPPAQYVTALFFLIFGHSLELSIVISVLAYAASVAAGVLYVCKYWGEKCAIVGGVFAAVGVPYALHNSVQPSGGYDYTLLIPAMFLGLAAIVYQKGWSVWRCLCAGVLTGYFWYSCKLSLLSIGTIFIVFVTNVQGRKLIKDLLTTRLVLYFGSAAVVGYLPEILYRLSHPAKHELLGFATSSQIWASIYWLCRVLPAYFDGDPLARQPEGVHYLRHHYDENFPRVAADFLGIFVTWIVVGFILTQLAKAWRQKNVPILLMAIYPVINALAIVFSRVAAGEYYAPKRYLYTSAIILLLWAGIKLCDCLERKNWLMVGLIGFLVPMSAVHQRNMLSLPDELRDYREVVRQLRENNLHFGVTFYSYAFALTALSDEDLTFGVLDYNQHPAYEQLVSQQDTLVLVFPTGRLNPPDHAQLYGFTFSRVGEIHEVGELSWTVYKRAAHSEPPSNRE
jgi:hypothetical protein